MLQESAIAGCKLFAERLASWGLDEEDEIQAPRGSVQFMASS